MADIRQSPEYAKHLELLGWRTEKIDNCYIFIRQFPLIGSFIKIQRPQTLPPIEKLLAVVKKYRAFQVCLEPGEKFRNLEIKKFRSFGFRPSSPSLPSKTLHIDLTRPEDKIFANFSSSKRRDIRRANRDKVVVKESENIGDLIALKNAQHGFLGRALKVDKQFRALWQAFRPEKASLLLAYCSFRHPEGTLCHPEFISGSLPLRFRNKIRNDASLAGVLLLFHDKVAYYYQATSNKQGNRLAAPTLLVWEALKLAKKKGCKIFDFEGIYDSRFPQKSWLGFTKFKKGFGGKEIIYPQPLVKTSFLWYK